MTDSSKMKIKLKSYFDRVSLELEKIIDVNTKALRAILKEYPTARDITDWLNNIASVATQGRYDPSKIKLMKETAKSSVGIYSFAIALNIQKCIQTLGLKERQIDVIEKAIGSHPIVKNSPLHQLPGINDIEIGYIMSTITSIDHFASPRKLVAYTGLDPKTKQSGTWSAITTRMSKRGNKLLRYALIWASFNMTRKEGAMKDYYNLKIDQGKSHFNALGHCAAKLYRYIFWILNHPDEEFKHQ